MGICTHEGPGAAVQPGEGRAVGRVRRGRLCASADGYSLLELLITVMVIGIVAAIVVAVYAESLHRSRVTRAMAEIRGMEKQIAAYQVDVGGLPGSLDAIGRGTLADPWGNDYRYLRLKGRGRDKPPKGPPPKARKHKGPINSDFDLYSVGADGRTTSQLDTDDGRDDVVRAEDGAFVGLASDYVDEHP